MSNQKSIGLEYPGLEDYVLAHTSAESDELYDLYRQTHLTLYHPRRSSGHLNGFLLKMISCMLCPNTILEIGTFSGYGTICLSAGLQEGGVIHTIEINDELEDFIRDNFVKNKVDQKIRLHIGNAIDIIPGLNEPFDLAFIDGEKDEYSTYYDLLIDKIRPGGFILADNALWSGKVLEKNLPENDHFTRGILEFNKKVQQDSRVENLLLPVYDGIMVIRRLPDQISS